MSPLTAEQLAIYRAATRNAAWYRIPCDTFLMRGSDAVTVLHKLCSNDIEGLAETQGQEAFVCNVQGKLAGHIWVVREEAQLRITTAPGQAAALIAHLDRYVIREDVTFEDHSAKTGLVGLCGPSLADALASLQPPLDLAAAEQQWESTARSEYVVGEVSDKPEGSPPFRVMRQGSHLSPKGGFELIGSQEAIDEMIETQLAPTITDASDWYETLRVESATPLYGVDVSDQNLPQELGRDEVAISFTKGCYLGQETVARIDAMGHVNWCFCQFQCDAPPAAGPITEPIELVDDAGKTSGRITSWIYSPSDDSVLALGYRRRLVQPSSTLSVADNDVVATVR